MKYFITGGAGFIGSHMVDELIKEGEVTVFDNLTSGKTDYVAHHQENDKFKFIKGDLGDLSHLKKAMKNYDAIFHFAANPDIARSMLETDLDLREGTLLTYNVLETMRHNGVKKIIYSSGSGIYGDVGTTPTPEDFGPLLPISMYGASKLSCEGLISAFCHMFDMQGYIFRFANVVGKRQTHGVGYDFIHKLKENPKELTILGDGTQSKSYIHVTDVAEAMLFVYKGSSDKVNVFNVATDDYIDVTTIAKIVIEEMELKDVRLHYTGGNRGWKGDVPKVRFDLDKIHRLGWRAKYNSTEAIRKSIREMLERE
ncbi:MAG: NAD-dependent epimerase/dehydratase family protein [Candidatus Aminicenantes bacterium]|nr:MAG: NAD-dependent epimerase/dehydratase family protein [Candidatus Aminicenantes bacterium]